MKLDLGAPGYKGERVVAPDVTDIAQLHALSIVGIDLLCQAGANVAVQMADFSTVIRRRLMV